MKWRNHPVLWAAIGVVVTIVLAAGVVLALQRTGDAKAVSDNAPLIAAVIALGGVFTAQMVSIALEQQRTRETRDLEVQRAGEAALQNYFEQVGELLIEKKLHRASPEDNLSTVIRAQTLSVLEGLDPDRKRILLLFLYESGLIYRDKLVVSLKAANLHEANLSSAFLRRANLSNANLGFAKLHNANLSDANLSNAKLSNAKLSATNLSDANLSNAELHNAKLIAAKLIGANLSNANLSNANLGNADLWGADLIGANLLNANLSDAKLIAAKLSHANLSAANLLNAIGLTDEQIATPKTLEGATMPDGQKYEDWIKDKEG